MKSFILLAALGLSSGVFATTTKVLCDFGNRQVPIYFRSSGVDYSYIDQDQPFRPLPIRPKHLQAIAHGSFETLRSLRVYDQWHEVNIVFFPERARFSGAQRLSMAIHVPWLKKIYNLENCQIVRLR